MKLSGILCPIDFSPNQAVDFASRLARATGAMLHLIYVEENPAPYGIGLHGQLPAPVHHDLQAMDRIQPTLDGLPFERHVLVGDPAAEILSYAEKHGVDVIVMGTHGRTGALRLLMGSVAEKVVRSARCAVLTVKRGLP
jgi:nucleotide-binding universal stress UspA family protein